MEPPANARTLQARIVRIRQETPTVKSFLLDVGVNDFDFYPGQWIDLYIDEKGPQPVIGGFTMVSSPTQKGTIQLCIKRDGRAAQWLHDNGKEGDTFKIVGPGGQFFFHEGMAESLVMVAGGIGINPLMCIIRYVDAKKLAVPMFLFYSAKTPQEFLFWDDLHAIEKRNPLLKVWYTVTQQGSGYWAGRVGRIDPSLVRQATPTGKTLYYLCGPKGMPTAMDTMLKGMGIDAGTIQMEEW
jgi:ferredoxin-NADP reductase